MRFSHAIISMHNLKEHPVATYKTVVRQVQHSLGSILCMSKDRKLRIFSPGTRLHCIAESGPFSAEPSRVSANLSPSFSSLHNCSLTMSPAIWRWLSEMDQSESGTVVFLTNTHCLDICAAVSLFVCGNLATATVVLCILHCKNVNIVFIG
jgi:hypothetical protein